MQILGSSSSLGDDRTFDGVCYYLGIIRPDEVIYNFSDAFGLLRFFWLLILLFEVRLSTISLSSLSSKTESVPPISALWMVTTGSGRRTGSGSYGIVWIICSIFSSVILILYASLMISSMSGRAVQSSSLNLLKYSLMSPKSMSSRSYCVSFRTARDTWKRNLVPSASRLSQMRMQRPSGKL